MTRLATILVSISSCLFLLGCGFTRPSLNPIHVTLTNNVVFIGDSVTAGWPEDPEFGTHTNWIDKGIAGQSSYQIASRFQNDVITLRPKTVHILVGTNDVYPGWQPCVAPKYGVPLPGDTCSNILYMVQSAQQYGIKVVLGTIPPWGCYDDPHCGASVADETAPRYDRISDLNNFIKTFAASEGIMAVDYHTLLQDSTGLHYAKELTVDGVHPDVFGFQVMTPAVAAVVD